MNNSSRTHRFTPEQLTRFEPRKAEQRTHLVASPEAQRPRRGRRPTIEVLADLDTVLERADYAMGRIRRLEDQIANILQAVGKDAATLVINERPSLKVYVRN